KNTDQAMRTHLLTGATGFTDDDEVFHVLTYNAAFDDAAQVLKNEADQISTANGAKTRMRTKDPVTNKENWIEQEKNTNAAMRQHLLKNATGFTDDDEVFHVLTYNAAFDDANQVLKNEADQISTANGAKTRMRTKDPVTNKENWIEQ